MAAALALAGSAAAQEPAVASRGFVEARGFLFPQAAPNDPTQAVGDLLAREELFVTAAPWLRLAAGVDLRANSHDQVDGRWRVDLADRGVRRPAVSMRRLAATLTDGPLTVDVGRQFIRWGRTDIVTPTDRFAPRDFMNVVDNDFLPVAGARAMLQLHGTSVDAVWVPVFTPSRTPLVDQRWTVVPPAASGVALIDAGSTLPTGPQIGVRVSHMSGPIEYAGSVFDGFNTLPNIDAALLAIAPGGLPAAAIRRVYTPLRTYGGDAAMPTPWVTLKGEAAYFTSTDPTTDEYVLYVVQVERQTGEWLLVGGYAGEHVTAQRAALTFAPDRGLTRAVVGRATYTIDANRSLAFETAVKQDGGGVYGRAEYSQARGAHWRATIAAVVLAGHADDFLGQYRRNSHVDLSLRYSF